MGYWALVSCSRHLERSWHSWARCYSSVDYTVGVYFGPAVRWRCHLSQVAELVRGNRLPEVGCKSMSGVDKDEEPAYRLYFYSVGIILSFDFCLSCWASSHPLSCYLHLFVDLTKRETLHLSLTRRSLEKKKHSVWFLGKVCLAITEIMLLYSVSYFSTVQPRRQLVCS